MKRLSIVLMLALMANMAMAQGNAVASAYNYLKNGQPQKAIPEIDKACDHESTKTDAKTWFYKGNIYIQLYTFAHRTDGIVKGFPAKDLETRLGPADSKRNFRKLENGEKWIFPFDLIIYIANDKVESYEFAGEQDYKDAEKGDILETAKEAYIKSLDLDKKFFKYELSPQTAELGLIKISSIYYNLGIENFQDKKGDIAFGYFEKSIAIKKYIGDVDTNLLLYTGYVASQNKDTANVIKYYTELVDEKSHNVGMYVGLANIYMEQGNTDKAIEVIKAARKIMPAKQDLLLTEANIYLMNDRAEDAERILLEAAKAAPENAQLQYAIGTNYDKMVNDSTYSTEQQLAAMEKGKIAYKKAIEISKEGDAEYFNSSYNMGAMLNNRASVILVEARNLPMSESKKYDAMTKEATDLLLEAKPYLEKCHKLDAADQNTMIMLKGIYSQTKDTKNFKIINDLLKAAK